MTEDNNKTLLITSECFAKSFLLEKRRAFVKKRDGFTLVCLNKERIGLTMDIYLDCIGNGYKPIVWVAKECRHKRRKAYFPVAISDKPRVKKWF